MTVAASTREETRRKPRPPVAARRFGYVVAALVNLVMLYAVNRWPGWGAVPFLTERTEEVLPAVNATLLAGLLANVVYVVRDPDWLRALGDVVTTSFGLYALARLWTVFPVDFADSGFDWAVVVRILLGLGIVGSAVGIVAGLVRLGRATVGRPS
jgi:hypothetical protein